MNIARHFPVKHLKSCLLSLLLLNAATLVFADTATVPSAPSGVSVTAGSKQAVVAFTAPTSVSGMTITGYTVSCTPSGSTVAVTATGTSSPITVTGLTNATTYSCSVKASYSASSASSTAILSAVSSTPGAPTGVTVLLGSSSALVSFTAPTSTGGSSITLYTVSCKKTGSTTAIVKTGTTSPITVTGLTNGSSYTCTVSASNANGTGTASASSSTFKPSATTLSSPILGTLTPSSSQISLAFTKGSTGTPTSYSAACTASSTTFTQTGTSSPIVVTGLSASTTYSCTVTAYSATAYAVSSAKSSTTTSTSTQSTTFSTPSSFENVIATAPSPALTMASATTTLTNRSRYMISDSATATTTANYLSIGPTYLSTGYTVIPGTLPTGATYKNYLDKTIQFTKDSSDTSGTYYRLDSHLHPNNSLDVASSTNFASLKFRNNFGKADVTTSPAPGYVTFSYDSSTGKFKAKRRYVYSYTCTTSGNTTACPSTYTSSEISGNYYLTYSGGSYSLTSTGTKLYLYATPLSLGIPSFMNPKSAEFVTNSTYNFLTGKTTVTAFEGTYTTSGNGSSSSCSTGYIYVSVNSTYKPQVCYPGTNTNTRAAAVTQLAAIQTAVTANGESLRYSTDAYLAFRDALLANKLVSDSIADATPGQNMVPFVYFTNEYATSTSGVKTYHPMMVIVSYGNQSSPNGLKDVPRPPGASSTTCSTYTCSPVTRFSNLENYVLSIPMKDYGRITTTAELQADTSLSKSLCSDDPTCKLSTSNKSVYNYADAADNGILVNGAVMFPLFNNALYPSPIAGELSASGCHVGQGGGGPHCHSDSYQSGQGLGLYNDADYSGKTHPPLIGFGYDGIALFGQYRGTTDASLLGYSTALDSFGAHNHDSMGYHYHAHTTSWTGTIAGSSSSTTVSNLAVLMKGAYIGKISNIPYFRSTCSAGFNANKYLGGTVTSTCK